VIRYTASALRDIDRAYNWYEDRKEGLGDRFIAEVRDTAAAIDLNPLGYVKRIAEARKANLRHFPYALWFKVDEENNLVIACLRGKRDSRLARERALGVIEFREP
jgi:toxin ParE1/3/4